MPYTLPKNSQCLFLTKYVYRNDKKLCGYMYLNIKLASEIFQYIESEFISLELTPIYQ